MTSNPCRLASASAIALTSLVRRSAVLLWRERI